MIHILTGTFKMIMAKLYLSIFYQKNIIFMKYNAYFQNLIVSIAPMSTFVYICHITYF